MDARAKTIVRISSPADVLGVVPLRIGFHPTESIVVVCLHGPRRRDGLVMRLDLPPKGHDVAVARDLSSKAAHVKATAAVLVCYTEQATNGRGLPRQGLIDQLRQRLTSHGIDVLEALLVHSGRWWSYVCSDPSCCPPAGTELPTTLTPAAAYYAAEVVADGGALLADRGELERSICPPRNPVADEARRQALERAGEWVVDTIAGGGAEALCAETVRLMETLVRRWAGGSCELTHDEAARVVLGLSLKAARDEAATLLLDADADVLLALLCGLACHADLADAAPVCTVLAWVAYAHGHGALANVAVERALEADPGYEMARLIDDAMTRMITPAAVRALTGEVRDDLQAADGPPARRPAGPPLPEVS